MKQSYNRKAQVTYDSRREELEAHAEKIDAFLRTPKKPGVHFTPQGEMRRNGEAAAHEALQNKRVDIMAELETIKQERAKREAVEKAKAKSL